MKCCINCFESNYLKQIILTNGEIGNCEFCDSVNVSTYNSDELSLFFKGLLDIYVVNQTIGDSIEKQLVQDFPAKIFTDLVITKKKSKALLSSIFESELDEYKVLLDNPVVLKFQSSSYEEEVVKPLVFSWEKFSSEIKNVNRFHFKNNLDLNKLKEIFEAYKKEIIKGRNFYRARICSHKQGYEISEMWNPPNDKASDGRANPKGISYLYLSNDQKTSLFEVRSSLYDFVTIGKFKLKENLNVIKLSMQAIDIFTFIDNDLLEDLIIHAPFIMRLEQELAKPHRRSDSDLDYLPTQYISEFIKSMGYDGIEFQSAQNTEGYNLAVFYPEKFECQNVEVVEVVKLDLEYILVNDQKPMVGNN